MPRARAESQFGVKLGRLCFSAVFLSAWRLRRFAERLFPGKSRFRIIGLALRQQETGIARRSSGFPEVLQEQNS